MAGPARESLEDKLQRHRVVKDGCWGWSGSKHKFGYGWVRHGDRTLVAHRAAFEVEYGAIPDGAVVRHKCDNPECTNPDHLVIGSHADNVADRFARGRHLKSGGLYANTIISEDQISRIRPMLDQGMSLRAIGRALGFSGDTIKRHASRQVIA